MSIHLKYFCQYILQPLILAVMLASCGTTTAPMTEVVVQPPKATPTLEPTFTPSSVSAVNPTPSPTPITQTEPNPIPALEQVTLSGRIFDQITNQPIANAQVNAGTASATTNPDGRYTLTDLPPGQYVLSVTHPDYDPGLSSILTVAAGEELVADIPLYAPDTSPYPEDPMLTNPLDPNGAPTEEDAERLAREQGLTGEVVSIRETKLSGELLVNYKIGDDIRAAVAEVRHEVWELIDEMGRQWWIIKVCGNLVGRLPKQAPIATPAPKPLPPMAEVLTDGLVIRECAVEDCGEVGSVPLGERVEVFGCLAHENGGWCEVEWSGVRGWCTGQSLRQLAVATVIPEATPLLPTPVAPAPGEDKIIFSCVMQDCKLNDDGTCQTQVHPVSGEVIHYYDIKVEICVINSDGSGLVRLTNDKKEDRYPAWSPNKSKIAFTRGLADIYVMNADGSNLRNITNNPDTSDADPTWSPDGRQIAFGSGQSGICCTDIYIMSLDGGGLTHLTQGSWPAWSPDGTRIAFVENGIHVIDVDGSNLMRLTDSGNAPNWSPDGQRIVFLNSVGLDNQEIFVINTDGTGLTRLTNRSDDDFWPDWSPSGQKIVFHSGRTGDAHIYIMNADGSGLYRLIEEGWTMNNGDTKLIQSWYPDW